MHATTPSLAEGLAHTLAVARALVRGGRAIDLTGFQDGVGILCAKTLDMGHADAQTMLPALHGLLAQLNEIDSAIREAGPACG